METRCCSCSVQTLNTGLIGQMGNHCHIISSPPISAAINIILVFLCKKLIVHLPQQILSLRTWALIMLFCDPQ